ncbi:hypothetical protein CEXT_165531 [Caerostris extrusa]|uniref:Uncharacterized protein n=1 Tax=Caerostris extrusa TaxID=172846 RepID=A0AAV4XZN1_CAEEX|nr:hypothetical protein CEXT_165531 [Caerostris extrusa]
MLLSLGREFGGRGRSSKMQQLVFLISVSYACAVVHPFLPPAPAPHSPPPRRGRPALRLLCRPIIGCTSPGHALSRRGLLEVRWSETEMQVRTLFGRSSSSGKSTFDLTVPAAANLARSKGHNAYTLSVFHVFAKFAYLIFLGSGSKTSQSEESVCNRIEMFSHCGFI